MRSTLLSCSAYIVVKQAAFQGGERQDAPVLAEAKWAVGIFSCQNGAGRGDIQQITLRLKHLVPTAYDGTAQPIAVQE